MEGNDDVNAEDVDDDNDDGGDGGVYSCNACDVDDRPDWEVKGMCVKDGNMEINRGDGTWRRMRRWSGKKLRSQGMNLMLNEMKDTVMTMVTQDKRETRNIPKKKRMNTKKAETIAKKQSSKKVAMKMIHKRNPINRSMNNRTTKNIACPGLAQVNIEINKEHVQEKYDLDFPQTHKNKTRKGDLKREKRRVGS